MTTAPPAQRDRREWSRLEAPEVALRAFALLVVDGLMTLLVLAVIGDASCQGYGCRSGGVSTTRPLLGLAIAVAVAVVPCLVAWWRRRGLRTTVVVQAVLGGLLIVVAAHSVQTAATVHRDPPAVPIVPSLRPCAEVTLSGHVCVTYGPTAPTP